MISKDFKVLARRSLKDKWGMAIGAILLYSLIVGAASLMSFLGLVFVGYPLYFGYARFNMALAQGYGEFDDLFCGFREDYMDNAITFLIMELFIILWTFLLIIPGIIKSLSYAMVPYLLVDKDYRLFQMDALRESERMMYGNKMRLFKLYLSFLGWHLLGLLTLGILNILYVSPLQNQAVAHFFYDLKSKDKNDDKLTHIVEEIIPVIKGNEDAWDF